MKNIKKPCLNRRGLYIFVDLIEFHNAAWAAECIQNNLCCWTMYWINQRVF